MTSGAPLPAIELAERSDPGRDPDKQVNEDACGHRETRFGHLCVVCDGMGGHAAGREAAELALATIFELFDRAPPDAHPGAVLKAALEEASARVHVMPTSEVALGRPGSTAVAVLMHAGGTEVCHVGDSRAYLVHGGQIFRLTRDHSMVQELVDRGLLTPQQAAHHPDANRITRALGMAPAIEAELRPHPVHHVPGDTFVLCSDGLSDLVEDHDILELVGGEPAVQAAGKLVDLANARGGHDNVTVVVLRAREAAQGTIVDLTPTMPATTAPSGGPTIPGAPPATIADGAGRTTQPLAPVAAVIPPAPPAPSVSPASRPPPRRGAPVAALLGVLLALGVFALLGVVLYAHLGERMGKSRGGGTTLSVPEVDGQAAPPAMLAPQAVVVPDASTGGAIAPLEGLDAGKR